MPSVTTSASPENADIPRSCTVLVVGGGPGGSYTAAAVAREGINVVLLEAEVFPRYHIGESMLPAMRHFLRLIDLDSTFDNHGFARKVGAAFKLNVRNREGYTDFLAAGGPDNYVWNVVRSESDDIFFRHAGKCGAKIFDGVKVTGIDFEDDGESKSARPVRASYTRKSNASSGEISFKYIVDATGRAGLLNTKYLKNRTYNQGLKNVASWGYWKNTGSYGVGTPRENTPFFEALTDESGWAWLIPLHTGTSIGIVMNQEIATEKKKSQNPPLSTQDFYLEQLKLAPTLFALIGTGTLFTEIKSASDYSYSSSSYGAPGLRVVGDAGAFIDPFFSSGVHLALTGALSAAVTICAALRGDCSEADAARWHSEKVGSSYTWFLIVVLGAYKQMRAQSEPVLADVDEDNFDRAFAFIRPIIQGSIDVDKHLSQEELKKTLELCSHAFESTQPEARDAVLKKVNGASADANGHAAVTNGGTDVFTQEEERVLAYINARKMMGTEKMMANITSFTADVVCGCRPRLERGKLGLVSVLGTESTFPKAIEQEKGHESNGLRNSGMVST